MFVVVLCNWIGSLTIWGLCFGFAFLLTAWGLARGLHLNGVGSPVSSGAQARRPADPCGATAQRGVATILVFCNSFFVLLPVGIPRLVALVFVHG